MQAGSYLAAAFLDENNNQRLDAEDEIAGIAAFPFQLSEETKKIQFSLGDLDTSSFSLDAVSQRGNAEMEFSFSRDIILDSLFKQKDNCFFATAKDTLYPYDYYTEMSSKNPVLLINDMKNDTLYTARCLYASDSLGRHLDTARSSVKFRFKKIPEKEITPTIISKVEPTRGVEDLLPGQPAKIYFNRQISADTLDFRIYINEDSVQVEVKHIDAAQLEISSNPPWSSDAKIKLVQMVKDTVADTLSEKILAQFSTISKLKLASLKGSIPGGNAQTVVILQELISSATGPAAKKAAAKASAARTLGREFTTRCDASGNFEIKALPSGIYKLTYFKDLNNDGRLTSGSIHPIKPGEPWAAPEDDLILPPGDDNILKELMKNLPEL
jgi:uncharacterized protein (DUF2141 family)